MTIQQLVEKLAEFEDHLEVRIVLEGPQSNRVYTVFAVDTSPQEDYVELCVDVEEE